MSTMMLDKGGAVMFIAGFFTGFFSGIALVVGLRMIKEIERREGR